MNVLDFKDSDVYKDSSQVTELLRQIDLTNPDTLVVSSQSSVSQIMQNYIACQSETNARLIDFVGQQIKVPAQINGAEATVADQQNMLTDIANRQNLISRQLEKSLFNHVKQQTGKDCEASYQLINEPPMGSTFGIEAKVSDSGLRLISPFSGDETNCESALTNFLREVYTLSQTSNLSEAATVNVLVRKLAGSAQVLVDDYISSQGGPARVTLLQLVSHIERKFVLLYSPLHADATLHDIKIGEMSYSQLQARIQRLAKLATRLEPEDKRDTLLRVKESTAFLMAVNSNDRQAVNSENARRGGENLPPLTLDMMANFLARRNADKMSYDPEKIFKVSEPPLGGEASDSPPIAFVQDRGGHRGRQYNRGQPNGRYKQQGSGPPNGQRGQVTNQRYQRGNPHGGRPAKFVTNEMANVAPKACLLCGELSHGFKDQKCIYAGLPLMPSACRNCQKGAHPTKECKGTPVWNGRK